MQLSDPPPSAPSCRPLRDEETPFFRVDNGGIEAALVEGPGCYQMGLIDILQDWDWHKKMERFFKVNVSNNRNGTRCPLGVLPILALVFPKQSQSQCGERCRADPSEGQRGHLRRRAARLPAALHGRHAPNHRRRD